jgi:molybdopterin molybdotransferase
MSDYDPNALPVAQAQAIVQQLVQPVTAVESVALRTALGRVLARDIISPIDVPAHDNSAMDGYALRSSDLGTQASGTDLALRVVGTAYAGSAFDGSVNSGECLRIMTGAVMPEGCDTVVPQEFCRVDGSLVTVPNKVRAGDNRRLCGEDLACGKTAIAAGRVLKPADIGLIASLGLAEVSVYRRLRVAFFSSGDELRSIGDVLDPGCVYDSNRYTLHAMLTRLGFDLIDMGVVRDNPNALEAAFRSAAANADAIITSGGVSVGEADHTKQTMARLGDVVFWTIAMRPGRPMAFGQIESNDGGPKATVFGLPGNPVAVMVTFYHFVRDALLTMQGASASPLPLARARSIEAIRKRPGRTEYQRASASRTGALLEVRLTGQQGSGVLRSMADANCFVVLAHDQGQVNAGDDVDVLLFDGLV